MARILVVDDIKDNVKLLAYDLADLGHEVVEAYCGAEALRIVDQQRPDCVLLDIMMPEMDGYEVCRRMKADPRMATVPIIMVSAKSSDDNIVEGLKNGANDYVTKPFNIDIVMARIDSALRVKQARDEVARTNEKLATANALLDKKNARLRELYNTAHQFVDNVSHEFRTPLTVIKEFTSIIRERLAGEITDEQEEYLDLVLGRVDDLHLMVNDMLDISKLEAGMLTVRRKSCSLEDIFERLKPALQRKAASGNVDLTFQEVGDMPAVYCDAEKLGRVLINLAVNAIKFSGDNPRVSLWARLDSQASEVIVGVTDNGPGIEKDKMKVIFDRFRQVGGDTRAATKGVGLGLNIAKELVALNFGRMTVESQVGKGSTFSVTVPLADPEKLVESYLKHVDTTREDLDDIAFITAHVDDTLRTDDLHSVDEFLQGITRSTDLVLWVATGTWFLLIKTRQQAKRLIDQFQQRLVEANRNRPAGALPDLAFETQGIWPVATCAEDLTPTFRQHLDSLGEVYV